MKPGFIILDKNNRVMEPMDDSNYMQPTQSICKPRRTGFTTSFCRINAGPAGFCPQGREVACHPHARRRRRKRTTHRARKKTGPQTPLLENVPRSGCFPSRQPTGFRFLPFSASVMCPLETDTSTYAPGRTCYYKQKVPVWPVGPVFYTPMCLGRSFCSIASVRASFQQQPGSIYATPAVLPRRDHLGHNSSLKKLPVDSSVTPELTTS